MTTDEKRSWAVRQLREKYDEANRLPLKSDFDSATLSRIKAFLGPWPRALEAAGLKEKTCQNRNDSHPRKIRERKNKNENK